MRSIASFILFLIVCLSLSARGATSTSVLLLPFEPVVDAESRQWIGRAVVQTVVNDLSQIRSVLPLTAAGGTGAPVDVSSARDAGKKAGAALVVFGSYQVIENQIRLTGQILDVETGQLLGGMKATGEIRDLFGLQDEIAAQARQTIAPYALARVPETQPAAVAQKPDDGTALPPDQPLDDRPADLTFFNRHNIYLNDYDRVPRRYYDEDDYYGSRYRYRYGYPWYPIYPPVIVVPPPLNNPPFVPGPSNIGGTISIGGSRGSGHVPPTMGTSIHK